MGILGDGPFRINASTTPAPVAADININEDNGTRAPPPSPPSPSKQGDEYLKRLVLLIPSEVLALYLTFKEAAASWLGVWSLICLLLVLLVRTVGTKQQGKPVQAMAVVVACVSFVLWIYATGGQLLGFALPASAPGAVSVAIGVWTFVVPYFYKGD